jgi:type II secretory pathway pseudopilin PulG
MRKRSHGLTLVEIIVSITVLFIGFYFTFRMLSEGVRYSGGAGKEAYAALLARNKMEEMRAWAYRQTGGRYNFNDDVWTPYDGKKESAGEDFELRTLTVWKELYSPCTSLTETLDRKMSKSFRSAKVEVWYTRGLAHQKGFTLVTLIGEPRRLPETLTVTVVPSTLNKDKSAECNVEAVDGNGNPINDLTYKWYVLPATGNGTIKYLGNGEKADFYNYVCTYYGSPLCAGGSIGSETYCHVMARAKGQNKDSMGQWSPDIVQPTWEDLNPISCRVYLRKE